jgi:hypothetical protein
MSTVHGLPSSHVDALQQTLPVQNASVPSALAHAVADEQACPSARLYVSARVGPRPVPVSDVCTTTGPAEPAAPPTPGVAMMTHPRFVAELARHVRTSVPRPAKLRVTPKAEAEADELAEEA